MPTSLRALLRSAIPAVAIVLSPLVASAQGFSFFGNFDQGPNAGTIAGTLTLAGFTAGASGTFSASSLTITQYPGGILQSPEGNEATLWSLQTANSFTTVDGNITGWQFIAGTGSEYNSSSYLLCLNTGAGVNLAPSRTCPAALNLIGLGGAENFAYNFGGAQGLTFESTSVPAPVPEPASVALLLTSIAGLGAAARRRQQQG